MNRRASTPATKQLSDWGVAFRTEEYANPLASKGSKQHYGISVARELGLDPTLVFKTLLAELTGGEMVVGVVPVSSHLDLRALARAAGVKKATMANPDKVERRTGYVLGGVSPFGQRFQHRTFVDASALDMIEVHVSGGRRGLEIVVAVDAFEALLGATFVPLSVR